MRGTANTPSKKVDKSEFATKKDLEAIQLTPGPPGKSAYEMAVEGGYKGTEEEFIAILTNGDAQKMQSTSVVLSVDGWTLGSDERYYQTVSVEGVTTDATQVIVVDPALTGTDLDADAAVLEAWQNPSAHNVTQGDGTLTFYAYTAPTVNIPINVGVG